jgi:hypothetical protein
LLSQDGSDSGWFVVAETALNRYAADFTLAQLNKYCQSYKST